MSTKISLVMIDERLKNSKNHHTQRNVSIIRSSKVENFRTEFLEPKQVLFRSKIYCTSDNKGVNVHIDTGEDLCVFASVVHSAPSTSLE